MTAFFDGFGLQAIIQYFICLNLSTQGAEPQLATAHDCLWEAKALGSLFFSVSSINTAGFNSCL